MLSDAYRIVLDAELPSVILAILIPILCAAAWIKTKTYSKLYLRLILCGLALPFLLFVIRLRIESMIIETRLDRVKRGLPPLEDQFPTTNSHSKRI